MTDKTEEDSAFKTTVCSTLEIFGYILFPLILFGLFYMTKLKNILKYTNRSNNSYYLALAALVVSNLVVGVLDRVVFRDDEHFDLNNFFMVIVTLVLTGMYFWNKIFLKNTFIVLFVVNLLLVFTKHLFKQFTKLYDYCYGGDTVIEEEIDFEDIEDIDDTDERLKEI